MVETVATYFGNHFGLVQTFTRFEKHIWLRTIDEICVYCRCTFLQTVYDEIIQNKDDEQSKISLRTIDDMTKLFTNFAKFG